MSSFAEAIMVLFVTLAFAGEQSGAVKTMIFKDQPYHSNYPENYARVVTSPQGTGPGTQIEDVTVCLRFRYTHI